MKQFFQNNNSEDLILFLCGWGMDERPLLPVKSEKDILFLFNYSDLSLDFDFSKYKKIFLIAYSCGVFMSGYLKDFLPEIAFSVAVNGTFKLFDEKFGITSEVIKVFEEISLLNYMDFRRDFLVSTEEELKKFDKNQPYRTVEDSLFELKKLKEYYQLKPEVSYCFDKIFIAKNDKIIPTENQIAFWEKSNFIDGGHFPFYNVKSFDEFLG